MSNDHSSAPSEGEFQDPLENYDPKTYEDGVEEALAEQSVESIMHQPFATIPADTSVSVAMHKLSAFHIACLMVEEDGKLVGVFSHRDVLDRVALEYDEVKDQCVREVMTSNPVYIYDTDPAAAALSVMAVSGYRHVPIVDSGERIVGIVSPQRVTAFLTKAFQSE